VFIKVDNKFKFSLDSAQVSVYPWAGIRSYLLERSMVCQSEIARLKPLTDAAKLTRDNKCEIYLSLMGGGAGGAAAGSAQILEAQAAYDKASESFYKLQAELKKYTSGDFYFEGLPSTPLSTQTDSRGDFSVLLPAKGEYILAVKTQRRVEGVEQRYYWLLSVNMDESFKPLELTDVNSVPALAPVFK